jgi:hypothetical protein
MLAIPASFVLMTLSGPTTRAAPGLPPIGWSTGPNLPGAFGARWDYSVAYFPPTDQVVVFGGAPDSKTGSWKNDTWLYSVQTDTWSQGPSAPAALKPRGGSAMAFDPAISKIVLFGGAGADWPPYGDTWLFNGSSWTQGPTAPGAMGGRVGARMVYADSLGKVVLLAGSGTKAYNDTWLFNGTAWTAGPTSPAALKSRVNFAMSYDPIVAKVVVVGGDAGVDGWYFDGTTWTAATSAPDEFGPMERLGMAYNPQLGAHMFFGGIGPDGAHGDGWLFRSSDGSWIKMSAGTFKPGNLFDADMVWVPTKDAMMLIGGVSQSNDGTPLSGTYFFRDIAPKQSSLTITPSDPNMEQSVTMVGGGQLGGYGTTVSEMEWYVNGVLVPDATGATLIPVYDPGDQITARIRMHDSLNVYGPWVTSDVVTVVNRPPIVKELLIAPLAPVITDTVYELLTTSDPDGQGVSLAYAWTVNGVSVGGDSATLDPSYFNAYDVIGLTVTPRDSLGLNGTPVAAAPSVIGYNLTMDPARPDSIAGVKGRGYSPYELVDIRIDSSIGAILTTAAADDVGAWDWQGTPLPAVLEGETHLMYGTGRISGKVGEGTILIIPGATISPTYFAAGDPVTFKGAGFVPDETVSVTFPGQPATMVVAAANGNANATILAPPEPNTGGYVIASAPSGSVEMLFAVTSVLTSPANGVPGGSITASVTGYGSNEVVNFSLDSGSTLGSGVTDAFGSLSATVPLSGYFGAHTLTAKGATSGITLSKSLPFPATLSLSPKSGPRGTVVTISSGPGWKENSNLVFKVAGRTMAPKTTDATGSVTFTYTIAEGDPLGALGISLYSSIFRRTAMDTFTVTG